MGFALVVMASGSSARDSPPAPYGASPLSTVASSTGASYPHGCGTTPVVLQFTTVTTGGTAPYRYQWSFGDGQNGTGPSPSHAYEVLGGYHLRVETVDTNGTPAWTNFSVDVGFAPCPAPHPPAYDPVAAFVVAALLAGAIVGIVLWFRTRPPPQS